MLGSVTFDDIDVATTMTVEMWGDALENCIIDHDGTWHIVLCGCVVSKTTTIVGHISCTSNFLTGDVYHIIGEGYADKKEEEDDF